jgi:hypothetical protein
MDCSNGNEISQLGRDGIEMDSRKSWLRPRDGAVAVTVTMGRVIRPAGGRRRR